MREGWTVSDLPILVREGGSSRARRVVTDDGSVPGMTRTNANRTQKNSEKGCCPCCVVLVFGSAVGCTIGLGPPLSVYWHIVLVVLLVLVLATQVVRLARGRKRMRIAFDTAVNKIYESEVAELEALRERELELRASGMPITVTSLDGHHHHFVVLPTDTVAIVKQLIARRTAIPSEAQALSRAQQPLLSDEQTLASAAIPSHAELALAVDATVAGEHAIDMRGEGEEEKLPPGAAAMTGAVAGQAAVYESTEVLGFLPF